MLAVVRKLGICHRLYNGFILAVNFAACCWSRRWFELLLVPADGRRHRNLSAIDAPADQIEFSPEWAEGQLRRAFTGQGSPGRAWAES